MPRERIDMTPTEVVEFARSQHRLILVSLDEDGGPWTDSVARGFDERSIVFGVPEGTRSLDNIRRDSRVCCILETGPAYYQIKGVLAHGHAQEAMGYVADELRAVMKQEGGQSAHAPVLFRVGMDDVASFDFSKIQNRPV